MSKETGGLGIRRLKVVNRCIMIGKIWDIQHNKESLWIRWVHNKYLKQQQSIWSMPIKNHYSWSFKELLQLREDAQKCNAAGISQGNFNVRRAYDALLQTQPTLPWTSTIWNKLSLPRCSFTS